MILWIDAQLSPALAHWISETFGVVAHAMRDLGLREAKDVVIFHAARAFSQRGHRWVCPAPQLGRWASLLAFAGGSVL